MKKYLLGALTACCLGLIVNTASAGTSVLDKLTGQSVSYKQSDALTPRITEAYRHRYYYYEYYPSGYMYYNTPGYYYNQTWKGQRHWHHRYHNKSHHGHGHKHHGRKHHGHKHHHGHHGHHGHK